MKFMTRKIIPLFMGFLGMIAAISIAVTITLNCRALYIRDMKAYQISEYSGYPEEEILENYDVLIRYNSLFGPEKLEFPSLAMSKEGEIHFREVKDIFVGLQMGGIACFIIAMAYLCFSLKKQRKCAILALKSAAVMNIAVPAVVGAFIAMNWEKAFVTFHKMFFNNDYWIFDWRTDPIILLLPDRYFMHCAILIIVLVVCFSLVYGILAGIISRKNNE